MPPSNWPAGAQGGTSARHTGAALSFVSCIRLFDCPVRLTYLAAGDCTLGQKVARGQTARTLMYGAAERGIGCALHARAAHR